ncbi:hypothetical protein EIP91_005599 [Steccherinum ochraceum]|uniref:Uncharacterized protein n=1 Tax=Steccherinum ochraceum TaxID=92696 RepID=A0A4R0R723_9APHY|nr:hypothetical protein EIP91_005599 [Steccherinum ochraceum]
MALLTELERVAEAAASDESEKKLEQLLADVCTLIASDPAYPNLLTDAIIKADDLLNSMVDEAYGRTFEIDFLPSFAQGTDRPLVADSERESLAGRIGGGALNILLPLVRLFGKSLGVAGVGDAEINDLIDKTDGFCRVTGISPGLAGIATRLVVDSERKLVYVADDDRVKSYKYDLEVNFDEVLPRHTLASRNDGPLLLVEDGKKILRGGKRGIEMWKVDTLPDHGPDGRKKIGKGKINIENSWRDESDDIERSRGTNAHSTTPLHHDAFQPSFWGQLSGGQLVMAPKDRHSCWIADLESGLKPTTRFLGHGAYVTQFSSSSEDQNHFLTACNDGVARLFDIRQPLPQISFDCGSSDESLQTALYIHVDGLPLVISGGQRTQSIRVWDVRAKSIVYELATGNNGVNSLAWDAPRSTLFAATQSEYIDRQGYRHGYRNARIPKTKWNQRHTGENWDESEDTGDEEEADEDYNHGWPQRAFHEENAFGYAFDCGRHQILRYKFGVDADPGILPEYGDALPGQSDNWF